MGDKIIINTFAIVVIGGLGSIGGSVITGFAIGLLQTLGAVIFPAFNDTLIFLVMIVVLLIRPSGLFGSAASAQMTLSLLGSRRGAIAAVVLAIVGVLLPWFVYPVLAIDIVAYALFAVAFDLLLGSPDCCRSATRLFWGGCRLRATILTHSGRTRFRSR